MLYISSDIFFNTFCSKCQWKICYGQQLWKEYHISYVKYRPCLIAYTFGHNHILVNTLWMVQSKKICSPPSDIILTKEWPWSSSGVLFSLHAELGYLSARQHADNVFQNVKFKVYHNRSEAGNISRPDQRNRKPHVF